MLNQQQRQRMRRAALTVLHFLAWWFVGLMAMAAWLALDVPQANAAVVVPARVVVVPRVAPRPATAPRPAPKAAPKAQADAAPKAVPQAPASASPTPWWMFWAPAHAAGCDRDAKECKR